MSKHAMSKERNNNRLSRVLAIILAVIVLVGTAPTGFVSLQAYAETTVTTWSELKDAIEKNGETEIVVSGELVADGSITIPSGQSVKITGDNATIKRVSGKDNNFSNFVVNGSLELGNGVTMTGDRACVSAPAPATDAPVQTTYLRIYEGDTLTQNFIGPVSKTDFRVWYCDQNEAAVVDVYEDRYIKYNDCYLGFVDGFLAFDSSITKEKAVVLTNTGGGDTDVIPLNSEATNPYRLMVADKSGYIGYDFTEGKFISTAQLTEAIGINAFLAKPATSSGDSGSGSGDQGCDGPEGCKEYTSSDFNGKGFFVQVEGGSFTMNDGAKLEKFITDGTVTNAAPVVVNGGSFTMNGGSIEGNSVGYNADNSKSGNIGNEKGNSEAIHNYIEGLTCTDTAGAVILKGSATGTIKGGSLSGNRGDTGALFVQDGAKVTMSDGNIDNNIGIHHAGATYIYDGGSMVMSGGQMDGNFTWNKGGAVCVSSETFSMGAGSKAREAAFEFNGGKLTNNFAVKRAGAIEVKSNKVVLLSGTISGNMCRALGGAIYVEGDGKDRMYTLYISDAYVGNNVARSEVKSGSKDADLDRTLNTATGCDFDNKLTDTLANNATGDWKDYANWNYQGYGGGLWLCTLGGNATFGSGNGGSDSVVITNNTADANKGQDINLRPARGGSGSAINIFGLKLGEGSRNYWVTDDSNATVIKDGKTYTGPLRLVNKNTNSDSSGFALKIENNIARIGGGIAANGTLIFGDAKDVYRLSAKIDLKKTWDNIPEGERSEIKLSLKLKDGNDLIPIEGYEVTLDGVVDEENENATMVEEIPWQVEFSIPITAKNGKGEDVATFTIVNEGEEIDPSTAEGQARLYALANTNDPLDVKFNFVVSEEVEGKEYVFNPGEAILDDVIAKADPPTVIVDQAGNNIATVTVKFLTIDISQGVVNSKIEAEKYINKNVHELIGLDDDFTYDVIAYVPLSADKFTFTDKLNNQLKFKGNGSVKVYDLGETNNHMTADKAAEVGAEATVTSEGKDITKDATSIKTNNNTLEVVFDDVVTVDKVNGKLNREKEIVKNLRGHYVRVEFKAELTDAAKNTAKKSIEDLTTEEVVKNDPLSVTALQEVHEGIPNKAKFTVGVANNGEFDCDTNTVTVIPEVPDKPEEPEEYPVSISKTDLGGNELPGAKMKLVGPNDFVEEWTSEKAPHIVELAPGRYTLTEVVAPEGYQTVTTKIEFEVKEDGTVQLVTTVVDNGGELEVLDNDHIVLKDAPKLIPPPEVPGTPGEEEFPVFISKTDLGGEEIPGATIVVTGPDGFYEEWTSTEEPHRLDLVPGRYVMKETVAPEGFQTVTTEMVFIVDENGNVTLETTTVNNGGEIEVLNGDHIILKDAPKKNPPDVPDTSTPTSKKKTTPPTGDTTNIVIWILLAVFAAGTVVSVSIRNKIKNML